MKKCSDARAKVISELLVDLVALDVRPVRFVVQKFEVGFLLKMNVRMGKSPIHPTTTLPENLKSILRVFSDFVTEYATTCVVAVQPQG